MQQMHDKVVFHPIKDKQLTKSQKQGSLLVLDAEKQKAVPLYTKKTKNRIEEVRRYLTNYSDRVGAHHRSN